MSNKVYDVIILGSGPAGLTAAIYTTRACLSTLVIAGAKSGGQLMLTTLVENYPGFPDGIQGPELMSNMRKQAEHFEAEFVDENFTRGDFSKNPFSIFVGETEYNGRSVIIATGADTKWLEIDGEQEKIGRGVSSCAPCDAPFFRNKKVVVAGGGDSAMEEALVLTKFAESVTLIHRRDSFKASDIMLNRVKENPKITIVLNKTITKVLGDQAVTGVEVKDAKTGQISTIDAQGLFVAIGHMPNSKVFPGVDVDSQGYIKVQEHYKTNINGVFVAGDVHDNHYRQAVTAAGYGCAAALEVERWLENQE